VDNAGFGLCPLAHFGSSSVGTSGFCYQRFSLEDRP